MQRASNLMALAAMGILIAWPAQAQGAGDGDFNGDGFEDLAVGVPGQDLGTDPSAGVVHVVYGSATGLQLVAATEDLLSEDLLDDQASEEEEFFGATLVSGDFDGDGFDDLAVGAPRERVSTGGAPFLAGAVFVYRGSAGGIDRELGQRFDQQTPGVGGVAEEDPEEFGNGDEFGAALAAGRVDSGSKEDLVIGVPGDQVGTVEDAGALHVLYGGGSGPKAAGSEYLTQDSPGVAEHAVENEQFASAVAAGDFGGGTTEEVAVRTRNGDEFEDFDGGVHVFRSDADGLSTRRDRIITRASQGIAGPPGAEFGTSLLAEDLGHDGHDDLVVGAPEEDVDGTFDAGALNVLYGSDVGLSTQGDRFLTQATAGVAGTIGLEDLFGTALAAGRFDGGPTTDLAVGAPLDNETVENHGATIVFYGAGDALAIEGNEFFNQGDPLDADLLGTAVANDFFGSALAAGRFAGAGRDTLAVGVSGDAVGATEDAGAVALLQGSPNGLTAAGQKLFSQDELFGSPGEFERFGSALAGASSGTGDR